jgi:hypothetical protein
MKIRALILALALLALAGCAQAAAPAAPAMHKSTVAAAPSCRQQYETWKTSATPNVKKMEAALKRVVSASSAEDIPATTRALRRAGRAPTAVAADPMPKCADPKGYYPQFLARITAAGDNAGSASGMGALMVAEVPLQGVQKIENKLSTELGKTVGKNH